MRRHISYIFALSKIISPVFGYVVSKHETIIFVEFDRHQITEGCSEVPFILFSFFVGNKDILINFLP